MDELKNNTEERKKIPPETISEEDKHRTLIIDGQSIVLDGSEREINVYRNKRKKYYRHSVVGIVSFLVSVGGTLFLLLLFGVALNSISPDKEIHEASMLSEIITTILVLILINNIVGLFLSIGGLSRKNRKKSLAISAFIFSVIMILAATVLLFVMALVEEHIITE
jgi:O-antigen/teichoic acid export membrane protein